MRIIRTRTRQWATPPLVQKHGLESAASGLRLAVGLLAAFILLAAGTGCTDRPVELPVSAPSEPTPFQQPAPPAGWPASIVDIDQNEHSLREDPELRVVVMIFVMQDCPIANSYVPEYNRLHETYAARGVRLFVVHVDPELTAQGARTHAAHYRLICPVVFDSSQSWVRQAGATKTPEAAVFNPAGELLYLGRIDDQYAAVGRRRGQVTSHDLRQAIEAILEGREILQPRTEVVGCHIPAISTGE